MVLCIYDSAKSNYPLHNQNLLTYNNPFRIDKEQVHISLSFKYYAKRDILMAFLSNHCLEECQVVVEDNIFKVIEQEHLLGKHIGCKSAAQQAAQLA